MLNIMYWPNLIAGKGSEIGVLMSDQGASLDYKIDKKYITARITFAIRNIPDIDQFTLEKLIELLNTTGNSGSLGAEQLLAEMQIMKKYLPGTCGRTLLILLDLLEPGLPVNLKKDNKFVNALQIQPESTGTGNGQGARLCYRRGR